MARGLVKTTTQRGIAMELFFKFIGNLLEFLDYAIPTVMMFLYRLFVLILLYSITQQLNEIIRALNGG